MFSNSLFPTIYKPTRITPTSATLLDNIFTNVDRQFKCGILISDISDHLPVFLTLCSQDQSTNEQENIAYKRCINENNLQSFFNELQHVDWYILDIVNNNVDNIYDLFLKKFQLLYDKHFPLQEIKIAKKRKSKPWLTLDLKRLCNRRRELYKKFILNSSLHNKIKYTLFRNSLNAKLKSAQSLYYFEKFNKYYN